MLMIVAHHYVANSGLAAADGPITIQPFSPNSIYLALFGAWGKTGINCFMLITGYFMCTSKISFRKFLKLMLQIYFYKLLLYPISLIAGYETFSMSRIIVLLMPVWGFTSNNFISCFLVFWLTIPFWTILVKNMTKRQHQLLLVLLLTCFSVLGSMPTFSVKVNYITWFGVIFLIASYIRLYPSSITENKLLWGWLTLVFVLSALASVIVMTKLSVARYRLLEDSNKIFAVLVSVSSFLWFKNMSIKYSKFINAFGAATFGVLLIHAGSDAMRIWLWKDTIDCVGHYALPLGELILYSAGVVLAIFVVCNLVDQLRINTLEKWFFKWYDNKYADRAEAFVGRIINGKQKANL